jgi:hypothetical protein
MEKLQFWRARWELQKAQRGCQVRSALIVMVMV